ncbi:sugar ABC transporter substrate-binding protein [Rugosimonospora africana]|uniref:Solute-binding protein n=1 Tax=Rugosimonospora africana TaxID=556532 RepID=A0A8J3QR97_9ACTN|nr:substrate-binding domain-containing protein [Rugosimonospora africana]GIH14867.1 solute-binding protein [Rugosimonospora africana]
MRSKILAIGAICAALMSLAACGKTGAAAGSAGVEHVAFMMPDQTATRYDKFDRPQFTAALKALCSKCQVDYYNASNDAQTQQAQFESALSKGAKAVVISAVDGKGAQAMVAEAKSQSVPVVAYDRYIAGANAYISYDNEKVGELQGQGLLDAMSARGTLQGNVFMINGSPTDPNAADFKSGAMKVLTGKVHIVFSHDTTNWDPTDAQNALEQALQRYGTKNIGGVLAAADGVAEASVAALKSAGVNPMPPLTGQDAELTAVQRIVAGEQTLTIFKEAKPEAQGAAQMTNALLTGGKPETSTTFENVPAVLLKPVLVNSGNIAQTVVQAGYYTREEICTAQFAPACKAAGL